MEEKRTQRKDAITHDQQRFNDRIVARRNPPKAALMCHSDKINISFLADIHIVVLFPHHDCNFRSCDERLKVGIRDKRECMVYCISPVNIESIPVLNFMKYTGSQIAVEGVK